MVEGEFDASGVWHEEVRGSEGKEGLGRPFRALTGVQSRFPRALPIGCG